MAHIAPMKEQAPAPRGIHRIKNEPPAENSVWVTDGTMASDVPESKYARKGYQPPVETLPWGKSPSDGK